MYKNNKRAEAQYLDLRWANLATPASLDLEKMEKFARIIRALIFAQVEAAQSGHPGSAGKVEQFLAMTLSGVMAWDAIDPKNPGRDRMVWSSGHSSPLLYAGLALYYEAMRREGRQFMPECIHAVLPEDLLRFRRLDGPQGHVENYYPLADYPTGPSGHGLSAAGGFALVHKSCGLPTKVWVLMGDAESEEGMSYEARNVITANGCDNLIVSLDYNHFGIDGPIEEVISTPYLNHWLGLGFNVIEADGHNLVQLIHAYGLAAGGFDNLRPTVVVAHTLKGKGYGDKENSAAAHGTPATHEEYVAIMKKLGFDIPGSPHNIAADLGVVLEHLTVEDQKYISKCLEKSKELIEPENKLVEKMKRAIGERKLNNPCQIKRPKKLPKELVFKSGSKISLRQAVSAWCEWYMKQTAFFYVGAGDLSKSVLTGAAENIYGVISPQNQFGRGIRYGIAENNMALMGSALTQDILPGGFRPVSLFGTYAAFTNMMNNSIRLSVIGNHLTPESAGFFIALASHDGPDTSEDGPTHQGLYWMSFYEALPGIKVYKPFDANEVIDLLFYALEKGEPIVLSVPRPSMPVLELNNSAAISGAYVFRKYKKNNKKKICLVISGPQILQNVMTIIPELEKKNNVKIVNVTVPKLFEELRGSDPKKADKIFGANDRNCAMLIHNGWKGWLSKFLLPADFDARSIGVETFLKSGTVEEIYNLAGLSPDGILKQILKK